MINLAQDPGDAGGTQHRSGKSPVDDLVAGDDAKTLNAATEDGVISDQFVLFTDFGAHPVAEVFAFLQPGAGQIDCHIQRSTKKIRCLFSKRSSG